MEIDYENIFEPTTQPTEPKKVAISPESQLEDNNLIVNLGMRLRESMTELQFLRLQASENERINKDIAQERLELQTAKNQAEESKRAVERAAAAVEKLVEERDVQCKKFVEMETKMKLLEGENIALRDRVHELIIANEEMKRREASANVRLSAHDSATAQIQRQIERSNRTISSFQLNNQRLESELKRLEAEVTAASEQRQLFQKAEDIQLKCLETTTEKLKKAYDENAKLSAQLGEERARVSYSRPPNMSEGNCERERELHQLLQAERAAANELREALATAATAQARLLALNQPDSSNCNEN